MKTPESAAEASVDAKRNTIQKRMATEIPPQPKLIILMIFRLRQLGMTVGRKVLVDAVRSTARCSRISLSAADRSSGADTKPGPVKIWASVKLGFMVPHINRLH